MDNSEIEKVEGAGMNEIWKDIVGYEGLYQVSNLGRVRKSSGEILSQTTHRAKYTNYRTVGLRKNGTRKTEGVHRLVAGAFIQNAENLPMVNHKDENGENNLVENLEWCDRSYNALYGTCPEKKRRNNIGKISKQRKPVLQYSKDGEFICRHCSASAAAVSIKGNVRAAQANISAACVGYLGKKTAYGYMWRYES